MLVINRLTEPGGIKRVELRRGFVRVVLRDGTEKLYTDNTQQHPEQTDCGRLGTVATRMEG